MQHLLASVSVSSVAFITACSSNSPAPQVGADAGIHADGGHAAPDTGNETTDATNGTTDSGKATTGAGTATLTVMNFLDWCSVGINGATPSTNATVTATVARGSVAAILIKPASGAFEIGADPWFGVDENDGGRAPGKDVGSGTTETSTARVTVAGMSQCVAVCCEEPNNSPTPCPTTNPCL